LTAAALEQQVKLTIWIEQSSGFITVILHTDAIAPDDCTPDPQQVVSLQLRQIHCCQSFSTRYVPAGRQLYQPNAISASICRHHQLMLVRALKTAKVQNPIDWLRGVNSPS